MVYVISFIIISISTGYFLTYLLTSRYSIFERITYGVPIGLGLQTWLVYLFSLLWQLQLKCVYLSTSLLVFFCLFFLLITWTSFKEKILNETREIKNDFLLNKVSYFVHLAVFSFFTIVFWRLFSRTIIWKTDGMYIGLPNNYGDLPLHLAYITSFVYGNNIPPQDPSFAGEKLVYPFLSDFLSAIFLKLGLNFEDILFIPGLLLTASLYGALYYFTYRLVKKRLAAILSVFLFFFSGGFGFYYFFHDLASTSHSLWSFLMHIPRDYTKIPSLNYHWITPLTCLNIPQRPFLFGFPVTISIFSFLYTGIEHKQWREFLFAGILTGALPFLHTHSFLTVLMVTIPLGMIFWDWRKWFLFFMPAFILSLPQVYYLSGHIGGGSFFKLSFGWMSGKENFLWFWIKNTSLFWPVLISGLIILFTKANDCSSQKAGVFIATFLVLFLLPNLILFAPWNWDNIKILIYWLLGTIPAAALALTYLYENGSFKLLSKAGFFIIMFSLTAAGGIDVFKYAIAPITGWKEFSTEETNLARRIIAETSPDAVFLNAPIFNHPVFLSGRKSLMGYPAHIWSHGYSDANKREQDIKTMLKGKSDTTALINIYKPSYVSIGPHEKRMGANKVFFDTNYPAIITTKNYTIYDLTNQQTRQSLISKTSIKNNLGNQKYGLRARYYDNIHFEGEPAYEEIVKDIEFNWTDEDSKPVSSPFGVIVEGFIDIHTPGIYTFKITSDDGSWLFLDNALIIDNGGLHAMKSATGICSLEKGAHKITIKYFDAGGGAFLKLLWVPPGDVEEKIPEESLKIKD